MQAASIHVNRLNVSYQLPRSRAGSSITIQRRLDRIASEFLVRRLENEFNLTALSSGGFYFIEDLELDLSLDLSADDDNLASSWSRALSEAIYRKVVSGQDGLIAFRDRAAFLVGLVEHLLQGSSWNWYYDEFADLRSLSTGQAILKVLSEDPDNGREIMLELARRGKLDLLLASLTDTEVEQIVTACLLPQSPSFIPTGAYARWTSALRELLGGTLRLDSQIARDIARVYLSLLRTRPELGPDVNLARFVRDVLQLRQSIRSRQDGVELLSLISSEDVAACLVVLGSSEGASLLPNLIRTCGGDETAALLRDLETTSGTLDQFVTEFGGIFFLAPAILDSRAADLVDANCAYPNPEFGSRRAWLLFLIALQCLGPDASRAWKDKALTTFAGLSRAPSLESIEEYAATLTPAMHEEFGRALDLIVPHTGVESAFAQWFSINHDGEMKDKLAELDFALARFSAAVLQRFAARLGAFSDSSPSYLYQNFLASRATVEISGERIAVRLLTCPLQMILRMAGFDHSGWKIPWLEHKTLEFTFD